MAGPNDYYPQRECAETAGNCLKTADWASVAAGVATDRAVAIATVVGPAAAVGQVAAGASGWETEASRTRGYLAGVVHPF